MESPAHPSLVYAWPSGDGWLYATDAVEAPASAIAAQRINVQGATVLFVGREFKDGFVWGARQAGGARADRS